MNVRLARESDLPAIMRMLFDDRATPSDELAADSPCYLAAFREMQASDSSATYVAEVEGQVAGTFMLTFLRHLMRRGSLVAQVESVRVDAPMRSRGVGAQMMQWVIDESRRRGC